MKTSQSKVHGQDVTYELHSLGWKGFQNLCGTILSEVWEQTYQNYGDSHDGGRDGSFYGTWKRPKDKTFCGSFTVQCKFTNKIHKSLHISQLKSELINARDLASKGLADNYILITNARLTATTEEKIKQEFKTIPGINDAMVYGYEFICQKIRESSRLRIEGKIKSHIYAGA